MGLLLLFLITASWVLAFSAAKSHQAKPVLPVETALKAIDFAAANDISTDSEFSANMCRSINRHYSPGIGRFISKDPIGFAGGDNLYAYADNRPTVQTDPYGLFSPGDVVNLNIGPGGAITLSQTTALSLQMGFEAYVFAQEWAKALVTAGVNIIPVLGGVLVAAPPLLVAHDLVYGPPWSDDQSPSLGAIDSVSLPFPGEQLINNTNTAAGVNLSSKPYMMSASSGSNYSNSSGQGGKELGKLTKEMKSQAEIIAKGDRIQKVEELIQKWGGKVKDWVKKKTWDSAGNELHYYEGPNGIIKGLKPAGTPDPF